MSAFDLVDNTIRELAPAAIGWAVWDLSAGETPLLRTSSGFGSQKLDLLAKSWQGHHELLQRAVQSETVQQATAQTPGSPESEAATLLLAAFAVRDAEAGNLGVCELFFRSGDQNLISLAPEQLEHAREALRQQWFELSPKPRQSAANEEESLANRLQEIIADESGRERWQRLVDLFCLQYGIDRCVLFDRSNRQVRIQAISGGAEFDTRSAVTLGMERLLQELRWSAENWTAIEDSRLQRHLPQTTYAGILPLSSDNGLLLESFADPIEKVTLAQVRHEWPVWKLAFTASESAGGTRQRFLRPSRLVTGLVLAGIVLALCLVPAPLTVSARGQLVPAERVHLFAPETGIVEELDERLHVGAEFKPNDKLLWLSSAELELQISQTSGEIATTEEQMRTLRNRRGELTGNTERLTDLDISIQLAELTAQRDGLQQELELLEQRKARLQIVSPISGIVLTWDVEQQLRDRPVMQGQMLLTMGNPTGDWEVLAEFAEADLGPLRAAEVLESKEPIYRIQHESDPAQTWRGKVVRSSRLLRTTADQRDLLDVVIRLEDVQQDFIPGTHVKVRVDCGWYPIGYVWFRGVIDAVRRNISW